MNIDTTDARGDQFDSDTNGRLIMPDTLVDTDILRGAAVQLACRAPSLHNSQPWHWVAEGAGLHLYVDHTRILPSTDKSGREPTSAAAPCSTIYASR
jgi:hypothetical protein